MNTQDRRNRIINAFNHRMDGNARVNDTPRAKAHGFFPYTSLA